MRREIDRRWASLLQPLTSENRPCSSLLGLDKEGKRLRKLRSWQQVLGKITENAGYEDSALTNVLGDMDNPVELPTGLSVPVPLHD